MDRASDPNLGSTWKLGKKRQYSATNNFSSYSLKVLMVELDKVQAVQPVSYFLGIMHTDDNYEYGSIMCQASLSVHRATSI